MPSYSFKSVVCTLTGLGPAGLVTIPLSGGVGAAKEGIKFADVEDKNTMTHGADGEWEHSQNAGDGATADVNLQHTSRANMPLQELYNFQKENPQAWGTNVISVVDWARGDWHNLEGCAFKRDVDESYASATEARVWQFDVGKRDSHIGPGRPAL